MKKRQGNKTVTVLIPAYNEEKTIKRIIKDSRNIPPYNVDVLVIIDSKTHDKTKEVAEKAGAKVINQKNTFGKGVAFRIAIPHIKSEYTVQIDADYQFQPDEIPLLIKPLEKGYDVTLGTRYQKGSYIEKGSVTSLKRFGSYVLSLATSFFVGQRITDVMAGFKGFRTDSLKKIVPSTDHFGYEAEVVIKAAKRKMKIHNVPITYKNRVSGSSSVSSIKHGLLVLGTILKTSLSHN